DVCSSDLFVDGRIIPNGLITILVAIAAFVLMGIVRDRTQAVAGLAVGIGVTAIVAHNDPKGGVGNFVFTSIAFSIAWTIGFAISRKFWEADEARERAAQAEREREERARLAEIGRAHV